MFWHAGSGSEWNRHFGPAAFRVLVAAAEGDAAFPKIFADGNFFLKAAAANAGQDPRFDASPIATRQHPLVHIHS